jgi:hypothetical protein
MSNPQKKKIILSASRVKQFLDCQWLFYQTYFKKVPDWSHPKTKLGSLAHSILESLSKPKHKKHYDLIIHNQSVYGSPAVARLVKIFSAANPDMTPEILGELDKVVFVALCHDFFFKGAKTNLPPEYEFHIDFEDFSIKGFMDRVAIYEDHAVIRDFKTQGKKFTKDQIDGNIQAFFYQMAIKHILGLPAKVEFILLRFPANKRDANRHLQVVEPMTDDQIAGFKTYLSEVNKAIGELTEESSKSEVKALKDEGFCIRVCSLKDPFDYWVALKGDVVIRSTRIPKHLLGIENPDEWALKDLKLKDGETWQKRRYGGCNFFYKNERPRSFS